MVSIRNMILGRRLFCAFLFQVLCLTASPVFAQPNEPTATQPGATGDSDTAPYDDRLTRLAEVLGSVHYLRNLCESGRNDDWRAKMQQLLDSEANNEPQRKERLTAAFNRGYRTFASVYTTCTVSAIAAEERYRNEGATLVTEITSRYGN
ncbi:MULTISPECIES: TIGR02301 family protein [unclassified Sinorhizobium]|uniref:TIGR02301 family protein n=1 Tax=unclassified Sinorhizobium TaxID=2613772 RepID=UPI0035244AE5